VLQRLLQHADDGPKLFEIVHETVGHTDKRWGVL
jgi:hypothetical protein